MQCRLAASHSLQSAIEDKVLLHPEKKKRKQFRIHHLNARVDGLTQLEQEARQHFALGPGRTSVLEGIAPLRLELDAIQQCH